MLRLVSEFFPTLIAKVSSRMAVRTVKTGL